MEHDVGENAKSHAQAGDRPEEASWEGSKSDRVEFEKQSQVLREGGRIAGPYRRRNGQVLLKLYDAEGKCLGQITNKVIVPHLVKLWEELQAHRGDDGKGSEKGGSNVALAYIAKNPSFPLLKQVVEGSAWWQSVEQDLGFSILFVALQVSKLDPRTIYRSKPGEPLD